MKNTIIINYSVGMDDTTEASPMVKRLEGSGYQNISPKNSKLDFEFGSSNLEPSIA